MTKQSIIKIFEKKGYKVTSSISTGNIVVTPNNLPGKVFNSLNAAYRYYFKSEY